MNDADYTFVASLPRDVSLAACVAVLDEVVPLVMTGDEQTTWKLVRRLAQNGRLGDRAQRWLRRRCEASVSSYSFYAYRATLRASLGEHSVALPDVLEAFVEEAGCLDANRDAARQRCYAMMRCCIGHEISVPKLAWQPDLAAMPVLADALEDVGFNDPEALRHLREDRHWGGCYVLRSMR